MSRIYQKQGEIRIEADTEGTLHILAENMAGRPKVITIVDIIDDDEIYEFNLWVTDIDPLINALLDMKRELILEYGEVK